MKVKVKSLSRVQLFETPRTAAYQAPPSMGISRQEDWSGLPLPSRNDVLKLLKHSDIFPLKADKSFRSSLVCILSRILALLS